MGLIALWCYKLGGRAAMHEMSKCFKGSDDLEFLRYGLSCLAATDDFKDTAFSRVASLEDISIRRLEKLFRDIEHCATAHEQLIRAYVKPSTTQHPRRTSLEPRALPLIRVSRRDPRFLPQWHLMCEGVLGALQDAPDEGVRDYLSIAFVRQELKSA
jgi:hypothetical protein